MIIRRANAGDVPAVRDIVERAYSVYMERIGRRPGPMDDGYDARGREANVFVAEGSDGAVAGLIVLAPARGHVLMENVALDPDRQGAGIGRALLAYAEEFALGRGVAEVRLYTHVTMTENQAMYRRLGYRQDGLEIGSDFQRVHFSKRLGAAVVRRDCA